ncbi:MAG: hypothetical protein ACLR1E_14140 [Coprococcus sp.]
MFDFQQMYREKLRTPEAAVECVKDGDWVDYTSSLGKPVLLDRALAKRRDESARCEDQGQSDGWAYRGCRVR